MRLTDTVSRRLGLPEADTPDERVGAVEDTPQAGVTYAYIGDPNQPGSPHTHQAITD